MITYTEHSQTYELDLDAVRERCKEDLYFFSKWVLGFDRLDPHIHLPLCELLQHREIRRKLIVLPRAWYKTTICSQAYPIWLSIRDPNVRILLAQNTHNNAKSKLKVIRDHWTNNDLLKTLFPELLPTSGCTWTSESLCLNRDASYAESTFECIGVKGQATSRHYNVIIEDDTVAPDFDELGEEALAPTHEDIKKAINWHRLVMPLMDDPGVDENIVVGTRWYEHDLISHILEKEEHFYAYMRSCREDAEGNSDPKGEITYPERFGVEVLKEYESSLGPYFYQTLMLNHPVATGEMVFKPEWFQEYEELPFVKFLHFYTTVDCATDPELAIGRADDLDYSTCLTTAKDLRNGHIFVVDYQRARCSPGQHINFIFEQVKRWKPVMVGYEDVAYQRSMNYWLKEMMKQHQFYFRIEPVRRTGRKSKETFIMGLQPMIAAGNLFIRPHMKELVAEFLSFPRGRHDDLIDTLAMQTQMWKQTRGVEPTPQADYETAPFSFEAAKDEIRRRNRTSRDSIIMDPVRSAQTFSLLR